MISNNSRSQSKNFYLQFLELEELKHLLRQESIHYPYSAKTKDHVLELATKDKERIPMSLVKSFFSQVTREFDPYSLWKMI